VLNTISTLLMVGLGHTYGNRMVAVRQDNDKLRARARRALADIAGVSDAEATTALQAAGDARTALVVLLTGADTATAAAAVKRHDGRVRDAVQALQGGERGDR
jgi:N-acetylmuramic acid 6-phosphate etherase